MDNYKQTFLIFFSILIFLIIFFLNSCAIKIQRGQIQYDDDVEITSNRGIIVKNIVNFSHKSNKIGKYTAIIIGIDTYNDARIPKLKAAVKDAEAISAILYSKYNFNDILMLKNHEATRFSIDMAFRKKTLSLTANDNLLIYYAGHGDIDRVLGGGWWLPYDAVADDPSTYIDNAIINRYIKAINARHVLIISDSCYSGTLFGETRTLPNIIISDKFYLDLYNEKSRWGMTSGNKSPVIDESSYGHSIFTYHLLKKLKDNKKLYITPLEIYNDIGHIVRNNSEQMPLCRPLLYSGDQGGEFIFLTGQS